jgi:hypothetical protein
MTEDQKINESEEPESSENGDSTTKKHRSPNYPFIGLESALERARELQKVAGVHPVRVTTAWETWNYKKGGGNQVVAALDAYGLISIESGIADSRQIKLTLEARKILDETSERGILLKTAALSPLLHKEIWEYFEGDLPPNDKVIREYLVYQRNFNPSYVDKFIEQFKETLVFAKVSKNDKINAVDGSNTNSEQASTNLTDTNKLSSMDSGEQVRQAMALPAGRIFKASIEVFENGKLDVIFAGSMNRFTVGLLQDIYDIVEKHDPQVGEPQKEISVGNPPLLKSGEENTDSQ